MCYCLPPFIICLACFCRPQLTVTPPTISHADCHLHHQLQPPIACCCQFVFPTPCHTLITHAVGCTPCRLLLSVAPPPSPMLSVAPPSPVLSVLHPPIACCHRLHPPSPRAVGCAPRCPCCRSCPIAPCASRPLLAHVVRRAPPPPVLWFVPLLARAMCHTPRCPCRVSHPSSPVAVVALLVAHVCALHPSSPVAVVVAPHRPCLASCPLSPMPWSRPSSPMSCVAPLVTHAIVS